MGKHIQQRRRIVIILLFSLPISVLLLLWGSSSRTFTRSLDSYITSGIPWIDNNNNGNKTSCWKAAHAFYHCFRGITPGSTNNPLPSATHMKAVMVPTQPWHPSHCIDEFFTNGQPCSARRPTALDVVWTWANGSDVLFQEALWNAADSLSNQRRQNSVTATRGKLYR